MRSFKTFQVNSPTVVHEVFEQEVVIMHLDSDNYYTLNESGAHIWRLLEQGAPSRAISMTLAAEYSADQATMADAVNQFIAKLQQEQLIVPTPQQPDHTRDWPLSVNHATAAQAVAFAEPLLKKYTDMQDLLLLDPIHDVEDTGWPHAHRR